MKVFEKGDHKIIKGDTIEVLKTDLIKDGSVKLIFLDPPYNIGKNFDGMQDKWTSDEAYLNWCYEWIDLCIKKLSKDGSLYLMTSTQFMPYIDIYIRSKMHIVSRIVWHYDSSGVQAQNFFGSLYEPILHCVKLKSNYTFNSKEILIDTSTGANRKLIDYRTTPPKAYNAKKVPGNVWNFSRVRYRMGEYEEHPTQKPEKLLERIIKVSSNKGDLILDAFAGSFTTAAVAKQLKRKTINIEINESYVKIGLRRIGIQDIFNDEKLEGVKKTMQRINFVTDLERLEMLNVQKVKYSLKDS
jgi:adenine-specific DNA-methyltransferase